MEYAFIGIVVFLFVLAVFDLAAGVSNDASNFLNSAVGAKAASFGAIVAIASIGIFLGAILNNGMIEVVRNGIFNPEHFTFYDVICIFMAVMVADVILLNIFNSQGMPTSTTVSMVFELLGAAFAVSLLKKATGSTDLPLSDLLNTGKAMEVILAIFLSVGIAFIFGTVVQFLARLWFSFNYKRGLSWKIRIFGGVSSTAILYFLLFKGLSGMSFMTPELEAYINGHMALIVLCCLVATTVIMQALHWLGVNVLKVVVLLGTFALAMAFAGNDLVNFIGVPVTGFASLQEYLAHGAGDPHGFMMESLRGPASIPVYFLIIAGVIMVVSLATSKKARNVVHTTVNLASQHSGDETFGSSKLARALVRQSIKFSRWVVSNTPEAVKRWSSKRLDSTEAIMEDGAAFDLLRGCINLVLAGVLIAIGTSMQLPLSTTYVTFMVAMGTSLADRAWGRESAVFRITGVISVIGGWFITAGAAFVGTAILVTVMHLGGIVAIVVTSAIAIWLIIRSNLHKKKEEENEADRYFHAAMTATDKEEAWQNLKLYLQTNQIDFLKVAAATEAEIAQGFFGDDVKALSNAIDMLKSQKDWLKIQRRKSMLCFQRVEPARAIEVSTWFNLSISCQIEISYNLMRIADACHEHVDNNFSPLHEAYLADARRLCAEVKELFRSVASMAAAPDPEQIIELRKQCDKEKSALSEQTRYIYSVIRQNASDKNVSVMYIYVNMLQELQEVVSNLRKMLRADAKLFLSPETRIRQ